MRRVATYKFCATHCGNTGSDKHLHAHNYTIEIDIESSEPLSEVVPERMGHLINTLEGKHINDAINHDYVTLISLMDFLTDRIVEAFDVLPATLDISIRDGEGSCAFHRGAIHD